MDANQMMSVEGASAAWPESVYRCRRQNVKPTMTVEVASSVSLVFAFRTQGAAVTMNARRTRSAETASVSMTHLSARMMVIAQEITSASTVRVSTQGPSVKPMVTVLPDSDVRQAVVSPIQMNAEMTKNAPRGSGVRTVAVLTTPWSVRQIVTVRLGKSDWTVTAVNRPSAKKRSKSLRSQRMVGFSKSIRAVHLPITRGHVLAREMRESCAS